MVACQKMHSFPSTIAPYSQHLKQETPCISPPSPNPQVHASVSIPATLHHAPLHCLASAQCSAGAGSTQEHKSQSQRPGWMNLCDMWMTKWWMLDDVG